MAAVTDSKKDLNDVAKDSKPVEKKKEAVESPKPKESVVSSSPSSSAATAEPTPSTSSKDATTTTATTNATTAPEASKEPPAEAAAATGTSDGQDDDVIDMDIFQQIIELDDEDDDHDFAKGMAEAYFVQAEQTFKNIDKAFSAKDLATLSSLGHYLKGSSAALGVTKVQSSCEDIQHYGQRRDEVAGIDLTEQDALKRIEQRISEAKKYYAVAEKWLKKWIDDVGPAGKAE